MTRWLEATERAAQSVIDSHDIKQFPGETAVQALAWKMEEETLTYENGLTALVEAAILADRARRDNSPSGTETVVFHWSRKHGDCIECGNPAAYHVLDAYGDGKHKLTCSVCAAVDASQGQTIEKIEPMDDPEHVHDWKLGEDGYVRSWGTTVKVDDGGRVVGVVAVFHGSEDFTEDGEGVYLYCSLGCGARIDVPDGVEVDYR